MTRCVNVIFLLNFIPMCSLIYRNDEQTIVKQKSQCNQSLANECTIARKFEWKMEQNLNQSEKHNNTRDTTRHESITFEEELCVQYNIIHIFLYKYLYFIAYIL